MQKPSDKFVVFTEQISNNAKPSHKFVVYTEASTFQSSAHLLKYVISEVN